ncbi:MAG: cation:proton antiporter [Myxococcota bacterium]
MIFGGSAFFDALGIFVIAAAVTVLLARWLRLPSLVSYLAAGLLIGPITGLVGPETAPPEALDLLGEMGIVLLMFVVGLELSLGRIREVGKVAVAAGLGQVVFTAVIGFALCLVLGFELMESVFIATALTFSSTAVVVKLLDQKDELHTLYGQIAVGIFLVQDLVVVVMLTFLAGLGSPETMSASNVALGLARAFGGMGLLLVATLVGGRFLLPAVLGWAAASPRTLFVWSLTWCLGLVIAAHALGLSAEIGAFLAGLAVAQLRFADDLRRRTHPLMTFFIAIFFVSLGARMELTDAGAYWFEGLVLSLFVLIGNPLIFIWIIARFGYSERTSFLTSVTVAQISEFSFIFAAMGLSTGLIAQPILSVVGVVGVVTIAISAYMILYNHQLYALLHRARILRIFRARTADDEERPRPQLRDHVIVVGMNDLGRRVAGLLHDKGETVLVIDTDARKMSGLACHTLVGDVDYASTLEQAGLHGARMAISALRIENVNKLFVFRCRDAGVPVAVYAFDRPVREQLHEVGATHLVEARQAAGNRLLTELEHLHGVGG